MDGGINDSSRAHRRTGNKTHRSQRTASSSLASNNQRSSNDMTESQRVVRDDSPSLFPRLHDPHYNNEHPSRRARIELPPLDPRTRFHGDGRDFRRPAMAPIVPERLDEVQSGGQAETIDLTREAPVETDHRPAARTQRLPRYGRDIIDISSSDDEAAPRTENTSRLSNSRLPPWETRSGHESPLFVPQDENDFEFIFSRPLSRVESRNQSVIPGAGDSRQEGTFIDLTAEPDEDLTTPEPHSISGLNSYLPFMARSTDTRPADPDPVRPTPTNLFGFTDTHLGGIVIPPRLRDRISNRYDHRPTRNEHNYAFDRVREFFGSRRLPELPLDYAPIPRRAIRPEISRTGDQHSSTWFGELYMGAMDYSRPAFNLDTGARHSSPVSTNYESLPPPSIGFTRNPEEDEVVVCPNCGKELAVGESETERELWVLKQCGHAYCGTCVQARLTSMKKGPRDKGKQRADLPALLKRCVVEGCGKHVTKGTMVHVFLSS